MRWLLRAVALVIVAVAAGVATVALTSRSDLDRAERTLETNWDRIRPQLDERYLALATATDAVRDAGGSARRVVGEIDATVADWSDARRDGSSIADQIALANALEGLGRRLGATIDDSPRFDSDAIRAAFAAYRNTTVDARPLNKAVDEYTEARGSRLRRFIADFLGHEGVPRLTD